MLVFLDIFLDIFNSYSGLYYLIDIFNNNKERPMMQTSYF